MLRFRFAFLDAIHAAAPRLVAAVAGERRTATFSNSVSGPGRLIAQGLSAVALFAAIAALPTPVEARRFFDASPSLGTVRAADLPVEGREVLAAIHAGGPFAFRRDGIAFGNREGLLPPEPRGYYAEYTVPTPGVRDRGARRIIAGRGTTGDHRDSNEYYYTNDHYQSFRRILQ